MLAPTSQPASLLGTPGTNGRTSAFPSRLTRKESQLLALLQQNPGRCLARGYLLETIWGYRDGTKTRTLDVHVQRLRRKLGPDESWHILTVLRAGYAWQEMMPAAIRQDVH